jgi:hypothetical protein
MNRLGWIILNEEEDELGVVVAEDDGMEESIVGSGTVEDAIEDVKTNLLAWMHKKTPGSRRDSRVISSPKHKSQSSSVASQLLPFPAAFVVVEEEGHEAEEDTLRIKNSH